MLLYAKIRRMYFRDKLSIKEIGRRTSLSRNTIKKWLKMPDGTEPAYQRDSAPTKLAPFEDQLKQALITDSYRNKKERRTARKLLEELQTAGYDGGYTQLALYVRKWRKCGVNEGLKQAYVPLKFRWDEAFQFDWSEESLVIGGLFRRIQVAHIKLCASRAFLLAAYPSQSHEMLFDAHSRAFRVFGGVPLRGIYDNMKTAVDKVQSGKERIVNSRFTALASYYLFDPDFCNVAAGWEKGIVEKNVQDSRRHIWQDAGQQCFSSFADLNLWLEARCQQQWSAWSWPDGQSMTIKDALDIERPELMPMPGVFDGYVEVIARVSSTCLVTIKRNRYSVPCYYANRRVSVRLYPDRLAIYADDALMASHPRLFDRDQVSYDWLHYLPLLERKPGALRNGAPFMGMPAALLALQKCLLRRPGGDRAMVEVLSNVSKLGLDAVVAAVQNCLDSGYTGIEPIRLVLNRLQQSIQSEPMSVRTPEALRLNEAPIADTSRYDQLNPLQNQAGLIKEKENA